MKKVIVSLLAMVLIGSTVLADIDGTGNISPTSQIKAADINYKFSQIGVALHNKGLPEKTFNQVQAGSPISKHSILSNLYLINEIYPLGNELVASLGNTISSTEINNLFNSTISLIQNHQQITYQTIDTTPSCVSLNLQACDGTHSISKTYTCEQYIDGVKNESYSGNECSALSDMNPVLCMSPAGNVVDSVLNGSVSNFCEIGSIVKINPVITCNSGYVENNGLCESQIMNSILVPVFLERGLQGSLMGMHTNTQGYTTPQFMHSSYVYDSISLNDGSVVMVGEFNSFIDEMGVNHEVKKIIKIKANGQVDREFIENQGSGFNLSINTIATDSNNNIYIGGLFTGFNGIANNARYIAKLSSSGVFDQEFSDNLDVVSGIKATSSGFNNGVHSIELDSQDNIYIGGAFTSFKGISNNANRIAKLSSSGMFDQEFSDNLDVISGTKTTTSGVFGGSNPIVQTIGIDPQNNIYVGGAFSSFKGIWYNANGIAKLSSSGVFDHEFSDNLDVISGTKTTTSGFNVDNTRRVNSIGIDSQNNIYVGGTFYYFQNKYVPIVKLNNNGVFDQSFYNNINNGLSSVFDTYATITTITVDSQDNLYIGGSFTSYKNISNNTRGIAKLSSSGIFDQTFSNNLDVVNGVKTTTSGFSNMQRIVESGYGEQQYNPRTSIVYTIRIDNNGYIHVGGNFTSYKGKMAKYYVTIDSNGINTQYIKSRFEVTKIDAIVSDSNGNIYLAGQFLGLNDNYIDNIDDILVIKLNKNFDIDLDWLQNFGYIGFHGQINDMAFDSQGNLYVVGRINQYNNIGFDGNSNKGILKINPNGTLDNSFIDNMKWQSFDNVVNSIAINSNDEIYVGGFFNSFKGIANNAKYIAKLSSSGIFDQEFSDNLDVVSGNKAISSGFNNGVQTIELDSQDNLYIGGAFTSFKGIANNAKYIAKLSSSGIFNQEFSDNMDIVSGIKNIESGFNSYVYTIAMDDQNNLYVGGYFSRYKGIANNARYIAKLSSSGVFDQEFSDNMDVVSGNKATSSGFNNQVNKIAIDTNKNIYVVGSFTAHKQIASRSVAKISSSGIMDQLFSDSLNVQSGITNASSGFHTTYTHNSYYNYINKLMIDEDDGIYIGGKFQRFKNYVVHNIIKLNPVSN